MTRFRRLLSGLASLGALLAAGRAARPLDELREDRRALRAARAVLALWGLAGLAGAGVVAVWILGGQPQLEGALLALALGLVALGFVLAARRVVPTERGIEDRHVDEEQLPAPLVELKHGGERYGRRAFLGLVAAIPVGLFAVPALLRAFGIGREAERALRTTAWERGLRLVRPDGSPIRVDDVPLGTMLTVYPEGRTDAADSVAILVRVPPERIRPVAGREGWAPGGALAYSQLCTHAGCPVSLYQTDVEELFCPCHQSGFAVLEGARPLFGPATRPLPQLPLAVDGDGFLVAQDDFPEPVGPGFWDRDR